MLKHILDHKIWTEVHKEAISDLGPAAQLSILTIVFNVYFRNLELLGLPKF